MQNFENLIPFAPEALQSGLKETGNFLRSHSASIEQKNIYRLFAVTPSYLINKTLYLINPFPKKYSRVYRLDSNQKEIPAPPFQDINSPDLYLPVIFLIIFSLFKNLISLKKGTFSANSINSQLIFSTFFLTVFSFFGKFLFNFCTFIEIFAFTGYSFFAIFLGLFGKILNFPKFLNFLIVFYASFSINFNTAKIIQDMAIYYKNATVFPAMDKRKQFMLETQIKLFVWFVVSVGVDLIFIIFS